MKKNIWCKLGIHHFHAVERFWRKVYHRKFYDHTNSYLKYECCRCGYRKTEFDYRCG